jgi:hypothetical protein
METFSGPDYTYKPGLAYQPEPAKPSLGSLVLKILNGNIGAEPTKQDEPHKK